MASTSPTISLSSPSTLVDGKAHRQQCGAPHCITLFPPVGPSSRLQNRDAWRMTAQCHRITRNVVAMATGETRFVGEREIVKETVIGGETEIVKETEIEVVEEVPPPPTENLEILQSIQAAWDKLDDKYAVAALAFAVVIALWGMTGLISAIDRLPLVPGILELVGIGYSVWFLYQNVIFKPEREVLINKVKSTYNDVIGSN